MNLLIPINGLGTRFKEENYLLPKPLINVLGKPMIFWLLDNLDLNKVSRIIIPYSNLLDNFNFQSRLKERYSVDFVFCPLNKETKGAAETVQLALQNLSTEILNENFMIMDCDTFYFDDIIGKYQSSPLKNSVFYFEDIEAEPIYSYIKINENLVCEIKEKEKISSNANCGVYCFESGQLLNKYCSKLINKNVLQKNEFYISGVYELLIEDGIKIQAIKVNDFNCVGTPLQLKIFCENNNTRTERFCFDLDGTLVTKPQVEGNYSTCQPIEANINYLKYLRKMGHYIIVSTARRMRTHSGNVNAVIKDIGKITIDQLEQFGIEYDELHFGKPYAHHYVDDLAVNCNFNLEKQTGYYNSVIESRDFNQIEIMENLVIKSGKIDGEKYYYNSIQQYPVKHLFPKIIEQTSQKIIMEKIKGMNLSYLFVNNCLSVEQFGNFLSALKQLHSIKEVNISKDLFKQHTIEKVTERYKTFDYSQFFDSERVKNKIVDFLSNYELQHPCVIHGDPVFTNALVDQQNKIKFIDVRGKVGNTYSIFGDAVYDLAKVYQSLSGYDFILNNAQLNDSNDALLVMFEEWIANQYGINFDHIKKYTASLYFSLIPLHNNEKCQQYYQIAANLIQPS